MAFNIEAPFRVGQALGTGQSSIGAAVTSIMERMKQLQAQRDQMGMTLETERQLGPIRTEQRVNEAQQIGPIETEQAISRARALGPIETEQTIAQEKALGPFRTQQQIEQARALGPVETEQQVSRAKAMLPIEIEKATAVAQAEAQADPYKQILSQQMGSMGTAGGGVQDMMLESLGPSGPTLKSRSAMAEAAQIEAQQTAMTDEFKMTNKLGGAIRRMAEIKKQFDKALPGDSGSPFEQRLKFATEGQGAKYGLVDNPELAAIMQSLPSEAIAQARALGEVGNLSDSDKQAAISTLSIGGLNNAERWAFLRNYSRFVMAGVGPRGRDQLMSDPEVKAIIGDIGDDPSQLAAPPILGGKILVKEKKTGKRGYISPKAYEKYHSQFTLVD